MYSKVGNYSGAVTANDDVITAIKTAYPNMGKLLGFTIITDATTTIDLGNGSICSTMAYGTNFAVNIDVQSVWISKLVFSASCNIISMNFYYE